MERESPLRFSLDKQVFSPHPDPKPDDEKRELQILQDLLDYCEGPDWRPGDTLPGEFQLTAWVAWQLGNYAELQSSRKNHGTAWKVAATSVTAAFQLRNPHRIYANLLTMGNVLLAAGHLEDAALIYRRVVQLHLEEGWVQKGMARLNLGSVHRLRGEYRRAALATERGLVWAGPTMNSEQRSRIWQGLAELYKENRDVPGRICAAAALEPKEQFESMIASFHMSKIDMAMAAITRCKMLGQSELAERLRALWEEEKEKV
jgi:hypothetical protein